MTTVEDKSIYTSSQPKNSISEDFRQFIMELVEEVGLERSTFEEQKRWIHRFGEAEGVDCNALEKDLTDFFEAIKEWKRTKSKLGERMARIIGKECYLSEQDIDELLQRLDGRKTTVVPVANLTQDASLMGGQSAENEYISECIKEVCINGDSLSKYQKIIEKKYGVEFYQKCESFVVEMKRSADKKKFTNTSMANLHYLARQIGVIDATVEAIVKHFTDKFEEEGPTIVATDDTIKRIVLEEIQKYGLAGDLNHIDVSRVTDMKSLFNAYENEEFKRFNGDISKWNVSKVRNMSLMFRDCENFNGDLSKWDVSSVEKMDCMFYNCKVFNCDLSKWDVGSVVDMDAMFLDCANFNQDLSDWDVSNVKKAQFMFSGCAKFNQDLSSWDVSNVKDMCCMFSRCTKFNQDLSDWDVSNCIQHDNMFEKCPIREIYKPTFE